MNFKTIKVDSELEDLIPDFIKNSEEDFVQLKTYFEKKDYDGMRGICHKILGTALSYGFEELDQIANKLHHSLKENNSAIIESDYRHFEEYSVFMLSQFK